jgi:hypothetical protein
MKILFYIILAAALYVSWGLFNGEGALVSEAVHMELRRGLSEQLTQSIVKARPDAYNIEVKEFWTETVTAGEVKASFTFEFDEPDSDGNLVHIEKSASAVVTKVSNKQGTQTWSADKINLEGQVIIFKEGLTITEGE